MVCECVCVCLSVCVCVCECVKYWMQSFDLLVALPLYKNGGGGRVCTCVCVCVERGNSHKLPGTRVLMFFSFFFFCWFVCLNITNIIIMVFGLICFV